ncbi:hypothetical protein AGMMS49545_21680 [Betaproteobacteria bacterium]|nr:hypothetical protein AGMMS49545_21680 [Betaproteobacteria bacterium]GHU47681.1 hypothetical protein AGMMS50289_23220 [Betaproteobacteria bacterium]
MATDDIIDLNIEIDEKTQLIVLTLTNTGETDVLIENSFGFTEKELGNPLNGVVESFNSNNHEFPYGLDVKIASEDMTILSVSETFDDGYVQNRILISHLLMRSTMIVRKGVKYVKKIRLPELIGGLHHYLDFDMLNMNSLLVKLRGKIFVKKPVVQTFEKETHWIRLEMCSELSTEFDEFNRR